MRKFPRLKKSSIQILAIAFLSGLTGLSIYSYTAGVERRILSSQETSKVFVTLKEIPIGTPLENLLLQGYVEEKQFPKKSIPSGAIAELPGDNLGQVTVQVITAGQILNSSSFGRSTSNTGVLTIQDGLLAVTVSMSDPAKVANFLQPGSEISIFVTGQNEKAKFTQVLITRAKVLAIGDQVLPPTPGSLVAVPSSLITVAVTPIQAKKLIHASQTLSMYFGLLTPSANFDDTGIVTDDNLVQRN